MAFPVVILIYAMTSERFSRRFSKETATLRVFLLALLVAVFCVLVSRIANFEPGYIYGLFAGYAVIASRQLTQEQAGISVLLSASLLFVAGLIAYVVWQPLQASLKRPNPGFGLLVLDATLFWIFVLSIENVIFAMIPLKFLDGKELMGWSLAAWIIVCGLPYSGLCT